MTQGLRSTCALFWALKNAWMRQPFLISSPLVWGPPRMEGLHRTSALFCAPEKTTVRQPILILSPCVCGVVTWCSLKAAWASQHFAPRSQMAELLGLEGGGGGVPVFGKWGLRVDQPPSEF